jgi:hypothetical protein
VTIAIVPHGTPPRELAAVPGMSPGLLSAGIGRVPPNQTYLDITQGNRTSESLYDGELPHLVRGADGIEPDAWRRVEERADSAPAQIVPGLLASTLEQAGVAVGADARAGAATVLAADRAGHIDFVRPEGCSQGSCPGVLVENASLTQLRSLAAGLRGDDLLIAIERPPPSFRTLAVAVGGSGFEGLLTSGSTRTRGLVTTTDLAPTILDRLGISIPDEMNGQEITTEGSVDAGLLTDLERRLRVTGERREPVIGVNLLIWVALTGLAALVWGRRAARVALPLLALSAVYLPLVLLGTAALEPSLLAERLIAGLGSPALAALTLALVPGWWALAVACAATVLGYGIDVMAGSALTPLSLPGPNPASGSRFFGIGNEIEATVAALVPIGTGAALAARASTRDGGRPAALGFLAAGLAAAAIFAIGRFGADVGAAIVLPAGAAVAAAVCLGSRRGLVLALVLPIACIAVLVVADLVLGGGAHLTRSLLDAGGFSELGDVFQRRIELAGLSFTKTANIPLLVLALIVIFLGIRHRDTVRGWFLDRAALAGFLGCCAATLIGTASNDSGVIILILGTAYAALGAGFAWALSVNGHGLR